MIASAIVFGAGLVALVLHHGLKNLETAREAQVVTAQPARAKVPAEAVLAEPKPEPPTFPAAREAELLLRDRQLKIRDQAQNALNEQRPKYVKQCFKGFEAPGGGLNPPGSYEVTLAFDAAGKETSRKIVATQGVDEKQKACVMKLKQPPLSIPPPGEPSTTKVGLSLP